MARNAQPRTLQQAILFFADYENCRQAVEAIRWPNGVVSCPNCGSDNVTYLATQRRYKCYSKHPKAQFSLKVGTIFEDSPIGLEKWLPALWLVTACKNGISSYELARALGVTQKTAWFMLSRLRLALQGEDGGKLGGTVEVDETFIAGKARFMHSAKKRRMGISQGNSMAGKVAVLGLLQRHSKDGHSTIKLQGLDSRKKRVLQDNVRRFVDTGSTVHTDELFSYQGLEKSGFVHNVINHAEQYVDGNVHINGIENFWSLLKRTLKGTYVGSNRFTFSVTSMNRRFVSASAS